jgi:predicted site-specific integrase-resolvase
VKMEEKLTYNIRECAQILGISTNVCYEAARTGQLPVIHIGKRRIVVPKNALHAMLDRAGGQIRSL